MTILVLITIYDNGEYFSLSLELSWKIYWYGRDIPWLPCLKVNLGFSLWSSCTCPLVSCHPSINMRSPIALKFSYS